MLNLAFALPFGDPPRSPQPPRQINLTAAMAGHLSTLAEKISQNPILSQAVVDDLELGVGAMDRKQICSCLKALDSAISSALDDRTNRLRTQLTASLPNAHRQAQNCGWSMMGVLLGHTLSRVAVSTDSIVGRVMVVVVGCLAIEMVCPRIRTGGVALEQASRVSAVLMTFWGRSLIGFLTYPVVAYAMVGALIATQRQFSFRLIDDQATAFKTEQSTCSYFMNKQEYAEWLQLRHTRALNTQCERHFALAEDALNNGSDADFAAALEKLSAALS